ncbi:MobF family relaxase [Acidiphilium iwatense]|uniref:Relaxase domain-containing protein n=1 Tax=Acidiphilium iwatense TaxID=768198 RepID=A0ABS9DZQ6_9PROT|nr:MobF family relaxase [Acidiphilium iwatense]MCF3948178.1 relaxase domain-containing protein [Acidiphilium iwatense]
MLTFRAGAASPSSGGAGKMADHLMNMTLPATEQDMATYYQRGMVFEGGIWKPGTAPAESNQAATASDAARPGTIPEPRRDMDPAVAGKLGIDVTRPLSRDEIAELLAGNRADGEKIEGKQYQRAVVPLAEIFTLDPMRLPTRGELENLLAGKRADGTALPAIETEAAPEQRQTKPEATDDDDHDAALAAEAAALAELGSASSGPPTWLDEPPPAEAEAGPVAGDRGDDRDAALTAERLVDADRGGEAALPPRGPAAEETPAEPRAIDVAAAFDAAGVPYRSSGGRLRLQATWRGVDSWTVSVNATTGQWRDFAAGEGGRFESLVRRLGVKAEAVALDPEAAKAAREAEARRSAFRKGVAGKLWTDATPGTGELREPLLSGSAGQKMRQRAEYAARIADAEAMCATARAYLSGRGLDAGWLMDHVRLVRPHANYDAREIGAGASVVLLTPMYGQDDAGAVRLTGVQRTYLTEAGEKIGRRMLGASGAWLLHPPAGEAVAIGGQDRAWVAGEGFETVASVVQATRQAGVVGYNAGGLIAWAEQFHGSTPIAVLADRDNPRIFNGRDVGETGQKAAAKAVSLIEANGGEAVYLEPPARVAGGAKGADWADALREAARDGLRQVLAEAEASSPADRARIEAKAAPARLATAPEPATEPAPAETAPSTHPELVRLYKALGAKDGRALTEAERADILDGKRADGAALDTAEWRDAVNRSKTPIGYLDFTFSADKSVSLAWTFAPTEAERNQLAQAHKDAVAATMAEIEQVIGQARKGKGGQGGTEQGRIGWITFDHYTARPTLEIARQTSDGRTETEIVPVKIAGDPQLHTHVAVPNLIVTDSGRVVSLNTMRMHGRIHEWGAIYQAHLGQNLRRLGARVELDRTTGAARLSAVPEAIRASFSKRTRDALADAKTYAASVGADWERMSADERIKLLKGGAFASRTAKADDLSDFASWRRQAEARGYRHQSVLRGEAPARPLAETARLDLAYETAARVLGDQFERRAVIKGEAERVAAARGLVAAGIKDGTDVDQVIARLRAKGVLETGVAGAARKGSDPARTKIIAVQTEREAPENPGVTITETRLTTRAHVAQESALVELAATAGRDRRGTLNPAQIKRGIAASGLTFAGEHGAAQRRMIDHLGMGGRFAVGIGAAGAGKTTLLKPLVASWQAQGSDIHGISLGWRQARELREAGLNTDAEKAGRDTIAAVSVFINRVESGRLDLTNRSVVVIDELGTIGTRQMLELLRLQERHGFRMVAIGDPRQCQSIEAGQVIGLLEKALGKVPSIETTVRQTNERAREIAGLLRQGGAEAVGKALEMKRQDGTAEIVAGGYREVIERAADLWRERVRANADRPRYTLSVSTPTNEDARAIGEAIRHRLQAAGALGRNRMTLAAIDKNTGEQYAMPIAPGEKVRLFARTNAAMLDGGKGAIGDNGSILEIASIRRAGLVLRTDNGREGFVKWETLADTTSGRMRLAYGYAMTTNTAQGITTSEHIFVTPGGSQTTDGFKTYVSGSRHRERDYWLTSEGAERQEIAGRRPLGDPRPIRAHDIWTNWTRNIARLPEKTNALDIVRTAEAGRRQAARDFLKGLAEDERRQASGARADLPRRFQQARIRVTEQGRLTESMARVARYREAAMARIERAAPSVREAVAASWEQARPVIEAAHTAARERLRAALAAQRRREDRLRAEDRRQAEARKAEQQSQRRGRGR